MHTHAHARTHTEEGSQETEWSRAEHLDLPLVTHSGISGTDGMRDGERECTLGETHTISTYKVKCMNTNTDKRQHMEVPSNPSLFVALRSEMSLTSTEMC